MPPQNTHLLIVPTYNEAQNVSAFLDSVFNEAGEFSLDVLVVDDNSPDGTALQVRNHALYGVRVFLHSRSGKLGLGSAYREGFHWGLDRGYEWFIEMDCDFSHPTKSLPMMLSTLGTYDLAIGSRYVEGGGVENWGLFRRLLSRGGSLYARNILGFPIRDFTGGFNGWSRGLLKKIDVDTIHSDGYSFQIELKYRALKLHASWKEFPIVFRDRMQGQSKMSKKIIIEALWRVLLLRFSQNF